MKMKWIGLSLVVLLLLSSTVSAVPGMGGQGYKAKVERARENYENAMHRYNDVKEKYQKARGKAVNETLAKDFLLRGIDVVENWLNVLERRINNMAIDNETRDELIEQINEYRDRLDEMRDRVNNAETIEELREVAKDLRNLWIEIRNGIRGIVGQVVVAKLNAVVEKAEQVELRIEEKIEVLNENGYDTSALSALLEDYSNNLDLAREKLDVAKEKFKDGTPEEMREGQQAVKDAMGYLRQAFSDVRKIINILKDIRTGKVFYGNKTGEVWAMGDGVAEISGSAIVVVRGNGTLTVSPSDAVVSVVGFGNVEDGTYTGHGKAVIRGKDINVRIEGTDIKMFAKGHGTLLLDGTGVYRVKKLPGEEMTEETPYSGTVEVTFGGE